MLRQCQIWKQYETFKHYWDLNESLCLAYDWHLNMPSIRPFSSIFYTEVMIPSSTEASWRENAKKPLDSFGQFLEMFLFFFRCFLLVSLDFSGFFLQDTSPFCRSCWFLDVFGFQRFYKKGMLVMKGNGGSYEAPVWKGCNIQKVGNKGCQIGNPMKSCSRLGISVQNLNVANVYSYFDVNLCTQAFSTISFQTSPTPKLRHFFFRT